MNGIWAAKLLDRFGKDWRTTEAGRILYDYAERIFGLVTDVDRQVKELQALKSGELRIGSVKALAQYLMPRLVRPFSSPTPAVRLLLSNENSERTG